MTKTTFWRADCEACRSGRSSEHEHPKGCTCSWDGARRDASGSMVRIERQGCPIHAPAEPPAEVRARLLTLLEHRQAEVDDAQRKHDTVHEEHRQVWARLQKAGGALDSAKERRDDALAELEKALPQRDPEPEEHPVGVTGR